MTKQKTIKIKTDSFLVGTKVREAFKGAGLRVSGEFIEEANVEIALVLQRAAIRCQSNNRQTVRGTDI